MEYTALLEYLLNKDNTLIEYFTNEVLHLVDDIVRYTLGQNISLSDVFLKLRCLMRYVEVSYQDELISEDDAEYFDTYFSFIYYFLKFLQSVRVRAPSGALTPKLNVTDGYINFKNEMEIN